MHDFDGHLLLELRVGALGEKDFAHPARTQDAQHPIRPYAISHHFHSMHPGKVLCKRLLLRLGAACVYESGTPTAHEEMDHAKR